jgi:hypothetical protein
MKETIRAENKEDIVEGLNVPPMTEAEIRAFLLTNFGYTNTDATEAFA